MAIEPSISFVLFSFLFSFFLFLHFDWEIGHPLAIRWEGRIGSKINRKRERERERKKEESSVVIAKKTVWKVISAKDET